MKIPLLLAALYLSLSLSLSAAPIQNGASEAQVIEALGKPMGTIGLREKTLLLYPQGEVTLKNDVVVEIDLMSEEKFAEDQERLRREREEWLAEQKRRRAAHKAEGESIRRAKMQSGAFAALPAKDKIDYWRSFQIRYPATDVSEQIATALESYETEMEELRSQQRIAELEARVAQAEKEAAAARLETKKLREETERSERSRNYGLRYYTDPVITNRRYYYRPPTVTIYSNGNNSNTTHSRKDHNYQENRRERIEDVADRASRMIKIGTQN